MHNDPARPHQAANDAPYAVTGPCPTRTRDEFLARMSHELRTPLNAVIGFSKVLEANRAGNQRPEDLDMLRRVRAGGEQLLRVIENVLEHADLAQGDMQFGPDDEPPPRRAI